MSSCEFYEIFKNTYFKEHLQTAASGLSITSKTPFAVCSCGEDIETLFPLPFPQSTVHKQKIFPNELVCCF